MISVHPSLLDLPELFTPAPAAEMLRGLGLAEMMECALRTRAYRRQVPVHVNGRRLRFTADDLQQIIEGQARPPAPATAADTFPPASRWSPVQPLTPAPDVTRSRPAPRTGRQRERAVNPPRRPKPWAETNRQGRTRYVWRFGDRRCWTVFCDDPEEARADATTQITGQLEGSWQGRSGRRMLLEDWMPYAAACHVAVCIGEAAGQSRRPSRLGRCRRPPRRARYPALPGRWNRLPDGRR